MRKFSQTIIGGWDLNSPIPPLRHPLAAAFNDWYNELKKIFSMSIEKNTLAYDILSEQADNTDVMEIFVGRTT